MSKVLSVPYLNIKRAHQSIMLQLKNSLVNVIDNGWLALGPQVESFEKNYAKFSGVKYAVGLANGLDAIIISLMALGIKLGDEIIVPSNTYIATLLAISRVGAVPVLVEPYVDTYNIDTNKIEKAIKKKTKAIIPVHLFGQACEMDEIMKIARKYKLFVVEDNAQSQGAAFNKNMTGSFGQINATSFYPGKNLGALGDGGGVTTNSKILRDEVFKIRNYGSRKKYFNDIKGYNSRLDEIQAAFLNIKLKDLDINNKKRQEKANFYLKNLNGVGDLILPKTAIGATHVYHVFAIRTKKRDMLKNYLAKNKIDTIIHYPVPPHLQKAYRELGYKIGSFPIAEELAKTSLSIPIFPEMTNSEQEYVIKTIKEFYAR